MIKKIQAAFQREGFISFNKLVLTRLVTSIIVLPIALCIVAISPWIKIRLIRLFSNRIGHYALNTELLLCALDTHLYPDQKKTITLCYPANDVICNTQLHRMWKRVITILPFPRLCHRLDILLQAFGYHDPLKEIFEPAGGAQDKWRFLEKIKEPHLSFSSEEEKKGQELMHKLGMPPGARFVCLLVRDSHYLKTHLPTVDWSYHDYRDADIHRYQKAATFLTEQGYYVIRMGKFVKDEFSVNNNKIIDYAKHPLRSDFMDIYLTQHCFFFMSTSCGLDSLAHIFRKPLLITNFPLPDLRSWNYWTLMIPKKIIDIKTEKFLTMNEIYRELYCLPDKKFLTNVMQKKGWRFVDNTADEISAATQEMVERLNSAWQEPHENALLQQRFWSDFPIELPVGTQTYQEIKMRLGENCLN